MSNLFLLFCSLFEINLKNSMSDASDLQTFEKIVKDWAKGICELNLMQN